MLEYVFFDPPNHLRIDFVSYALRTAKVGIGPLLLYPWDMGIEDLLSI